MRYVGGCSQNLSQLALHAERTTAMSNRLLNSFCYLAQLLADVKAIQNLHCLRDGGRCSTADLAAKLVEYGYAVNLRIAVAGGSGQRCFQVGFAAKIRLVLVTSTKFPACSTAQVCGHTKDKCADTPKTYC